MKQGAADFLEKPFDHRTLLDAIGKAIVGDATARRAFDSQAALIREISELTAREREVAAHLMKGLTSKEIGRALIISHRTVEIYRARLMRKYKASTTADLVHKLMAG